MPLSFSSDTPVPNVRLPSTNGGFSANAGISREYPSVLTLATLLAVASIAPCSACIAPVLMFNAVMRLDIRPPDRFCQSYTLGRGRRERCPRSRDDAAYAGSSLPTQGFATVPARRPRGPSCVPLERGFH